MESSDPARSIAWAHGKLTAQRRGAMLAPVHFHLPDGNTVQPFHIPHWADQAVSPDLPPVVRWLRGEWPCVPFGHEGSVSLAGEWQAARTGPSVLSPNAPPHGESSNCEWDWCDSAKDRLALRLDYPADHPIAWIERHILPDPAAPAIDCVLRVMPRADCRLPIGVHPTLALPGEAGRAVLTAPQARHKLSFPGALEPGHELFVPGATFDDLCEASAKNGGSVDATHLPFEQSGEDLLQLAGVREGRVVLDNSVDQYRFVLTWDASVFPSLLIWFSNRGRHYEPWNSQHMALGLEPVCSAFDLGAALANADNPISRKGVSTAYAFRANTLFSTEYRMAVAPPQGVTGVSMSADARLPRESSLRIVTAAM